LRQLVRIAGAIMRLRDEELVACVQQHAAQQPAHSTMLRNDISVARRLFACLQVLLVDSAKAKQKHCNSILVQLCTQVGSAPCRQMLVHDLIAIPQ
jgi:hypothetical protein